MNSVNDDAFFQKTDQSFRTLFDKARDRHEVHFAMALMAEMRGEQAPGWNTAEEAHHAFDDYMKFVNEATGTIRFRVALAFYSHAAEASGFYEIPKNMLRIAGGEPHLLWPFLHLVEGHRLTGERIAPNANKVLKDLAGHAATLGLTNLAEVFRDAFDADIRNGYAHADYIIWPDGLRLPKRNGGRPRVIPWDEFSSLFNRGVNVFHILRQLVDEYKASYSTPKTVHLSLGREPAMDWTIYRKSSGEFGITSGPYPGAA